MLHRRYANCLLSSTRFLSIDAAGTTHGKLPIFNTDAELKGPPSVEYVISRACYQRARSGIQQSQIVLRGLKCQVLSLELA